jgi:hypothetical protein
MSETENENVEETTTEEAPAAEIEETPDATAEAPAEEPAAEAEPDAEAAAEPETTEETTDTDQNMAPQPEAADEEEQE